MNEMGMIPRQTLAQMAEAWTKASEEVKQAMELLQAASGRLRMAYGERGYRFDFGVHYRCQDYTDHARLMKEVQKEVWSVLIERMALRKIMSLADQSKLDGQLKSGEGMPEITLANLIGMLEGTMANIPEMLERLVKEVYEWLRPWEQSKRDYVTNQANLWKLGRKVIRGYCVEKAYSRMWRVNYHRQSNLTALDNVFHALDGKGLPKSHHGPLTDAIAALPTSQTTGETDYFRFKCYGNGNLHLEFKRMDLVEKLNAVAGGMRLGNPMQQAA